MTAKLTRDCLRLPLAAAVALAMALIVVAPAPLASAAEDPVALVDQIGGQGVAAFQPNVPVPQRLTQLGNLFQADFDVRGIGTFALGNYRTLATPRERHEYFKLFNEFAVRAVSHKLNDYAGAAFKITGNRRAADGQTIVLSQLSRSGGDPLPLQWFVKEKHGRLMVTDLVVGDTSMKTALRDQFASWIVNNGGRFGALLAVMRQMNPQLH